MSTEGDGSSCATELFIERERGEVVHARLSERWVFHSEGDSLDASRGGCLSPCNECVTLIDGADTYCSHACEKDSECGEGETCFGCGEFKACLLRCDSDDDCDADSSCSEGICLWST